MTSPGREDLIRELPYVRRYARALTGSQARGDTLVADSLRAMLAAPPRQAGQNDMVDLRLGLYASVTRASMHQAPVAAPGGLSAVQRQLLLLTALEGLELSQAALATGLDDAVAELALVEARSHLHKAAATDVLIIEDEPIIAMDLEELVQGCGHRVVGVASSEQEAIEIALRTRPGLILADINLGLGGDGASAVAAITHRHPAPVIFVTAYPERLLTGEAVEPAFVITKPFEPLTLAIATYQAVTGGVRLS